MGNPWCETCKEEVEAETNDSNGFTCCTQCGKILDDNVFSTDPTFSKTAGGASQVRSACRESGRFSFILPVCVPHFLARRPSIPHRRSRLYPHGCSEAPAADTNCMFESCPARRCHTGPPTLPEYSTGTSTRIAKLHCVPVDGRHHYS